MECLQEEPRSPRGYLGGLREGDGGPGRTRTDHILLAKQALYQMSYGPIRGHLCIDGRDYSSAHRFCVGPWTFR